MQVILLKDVPKLGRQYDVKNVADGHAINFLFPQGLAEMATKEKVSALEEKRAAIAHMREAEGKQLEAALQKLDGAQVSIKAGKANDQGGLYKAVDAEAVSEALSKHAGAKITEDVFDLPTPIKNTGEHKLTLKNGEQTVEVTLVVEAA